MAETIRILIVDDHRLVRKGLCALLEAKANYEIVGEAKTGVEAVALFRKREPDVTLMDLEMPQMNGIWTVKEIRKQDPDARILILTSFSEDRRIVEALRAGARGYLLKDSSPDELIRAIESINAGYNFINPTATEALLRQMDAPRQPEDKIVELTDRELEVVKLVALGISNEEIGERLNISKRTVGTHISNMFDKLGLDNRTQLALYALRQGLADLDPDAEEMP